MYCKTTKLESKEQVVKYATIRDDEVPSDDEGLLELAGKCGEINFKDYTRKYQNMKTMIGHNK